MAKTIKLLLIENVESLGIVGDVVNVRTGYARNFLLPRTLATQPSDDKIKELSGKRADAQRELDLQRAGRVTLNDKLKGVELTLVRSCNDQGILYGAVTQQDISAALKEQGHNVLARDVRIPQTIKRVDHFDINIKLDSDLDQTIKLHVKPDRELATTGSTAPGAEGEGAGPAGAGPDDRPSRRRDQWALPDDSGRVVGWGSGKKEEKREEGKKADKKDRSEKAEKSDKAETAEKADKPEKTERSEKAEKPAAGEKKSKKKAE